MIRRIAALAAACLVVFALAGASARHVRAAPVWALKWSSADPVTGFAAVPVPLGGFSDCNHNAGTAPAYCGGLPAALTGIWWAYPSGWGDTAYKEGLARQGLYQPQDTVWITGSTSSHPAGALHVKMFCCDANGYNEAAAVLPMKAFGQVYGKFTETWNVSQTGAGFKSAHLLWPVSSTCCEEDLPEADWDGTRPVMAFSHTSSGANQAAFNTGVPFSSTYHTSTIEWTSSGITFLLDGKQVGSTVTTSLPAAGEKWVIQNESEIDRLAYTVPGESAQMNITDVEVWSCASGC